MKGIIDAIVRLVRVGRRAYARKWNFLGLFVVVFAGSVSLLAQLDLLPEVSSGSSTPTVTLTANSPGATSVPAAPISELPVKVMIPVIGLSADVANPETTSVVVLDEALLKGAVRYPTSAKLGETGNIILFGHSSYLPVVNNQAYKAFNGIQRLVAGDSITVYSAAAVYTYRVRTVTKASANDAAIPLSVTGKVLTLSTCDSFGAKTDRFVVVADFVESRPL
jgi:LPXTG-site transpeptidase (sortase) family protein